MNTVVNQLNTESVIGFFFFFRFFYAASWALSCTCYKGLAGILAVAGAMGMGRVAGSRGIYREAGLVGQDVS